MPKLFYQPKDKFVGDFMPFSDGSKFYLYHQRDICEKTAYEPFGEPFGWSLVTTKDFVNFEDYGEVLLHGQEREQDEFIFAGSVFQDQSGQLHAFYTGFNYYYEKEGKPSQVLMHALGNDPYHWEKTSGTLTFPPQPGYSKNDWRDPFVLWDEERKEYLLILGARHTTNNRKLTGCTVYFTSKDLKCWEFKGDFWNPGLYYMHEMPDLFKMGDWWYLIISEYSDRYKMIYRMAKSMYGPWISPSDDSFDGRAYYAGRTALANGRRALFGWIAIKENFDDRSNFHWPGTLVVQELIQRADGTLGVKMPDEMWNRFSDIHSIPSVTLSAESGRSEKELIKNCNDTFCFECNIKFDANVRTVGIMLRQNSDTGEGFQFLLHIPENRVIFEKAPNFPWYQCMNIGLERTVLLVPYRTYHIRLIFDESIALLYIDDIVLSSRAFDHPGDAISIFCTEGDLDVFAASYGVF